MSYTRVGVTIDKEVINNYLKRNLITKTQLMQDTGLSQVTMTKINNNKEVSIPTVKKLSEYMGIEGKDLILADKDTEENKQEGNIDTEE